MVDRVQITASGSTARLEKFLKTAGKTDTIMSKVKSVCDEGVRALTAATPRDTGKTAESWSYEIVPSSGGFTIYWTNSNINAGKHIAILIRYGHGTRNGGYVPPNDFITPAMRPIFNKIQDNAWKAVTSA